ncbi:MarR family winged helix-turn-helix transcriptional regulator [Brevibacillus invocatus]|uniref:MarR family transcriptional regulator n=1 Tax=Brevibacillus invocatus TaxID=173959 RepID=A0A3M8C4A3_9BACL|nr:MarR family transcriptional regulator [Brevibacillus invocatus]MCM3079306.1 MarR family transcriptional regulator [Brevibacillus invocatus]MCM3429404.1 MarR family transcriptional regulator [Brevibacillus invocatus]RNB70293.1 MarR family transcriptional regulator [Brevibacillus invocatus]
MDKELFFQKLVSFTAAVHQVTHDLTKDVKTGDITPVQYKMLEYITVSQPVTLSEISDCLHMSMPNTSRELKKLCEKNLCEKMTDAEDRRKQVIRLSADGEVLMQLAFQRIATLFNQRIQETTLEDLAELERAIDLLSSKLFYVNPR